MNHKSINESSHFEALYPATTRFAEIEKILTFIKEGSSCQVVSVPGAGRSNLLGFLAYNRSLRIKHLGEKQTKYHFVYLNFSEIKKKPLIEAVKFIFLGLVDSLRERQMSKDYEVANQLFKDSLELKDELVLFQGLKKAVDYLALEKNLTIVFLFDRFENYISVVDSEFFANLRVLRNRAKYQFSVVFSLNRPLEDTLEATLMSDFYEFIAGKIVYLPICDQPGVDFRIAYLEKITGKKLDHKLLGEVLELTGGHSNLMRLSAEALLATEQKFANKLALRKFLLEQKPVRSALFAIWNSLTPSEQNFLSGEGKIEEKYLENVGLVKDGFLTIPLLLDYLKEKASAQKQNNFSLNETGEILQGEVVLSDKLTSLEYRLLKILIEHQGKVLDKEEIINAVWQEGKTTLGVTDQALDQLIFRLRKKIEQNPNNPTHIQTVKGRGFKFAA
ncbi:MAG: helix-turn-helix domain-containing protein [Candidatus Levyibacteriota bacterium]|jgi:DNA-binding winged helix-turn-helix (wHTH) protein